tara:strand:- start:653 stop:874 length:222 start_codon:yes stop_codon:yes gene_type:complete
MSPSEREWGTLTAEVKEMHHKMRNQKMVIDSLVSDTQLLSGEVAKLRVQIRTSVMVLSVVITAMIWVVEVILK